MSSVSNRSAGASFSARCSSLRAAELFSQSPPNQRKDRLDNLVTLRDAEDPVHASFRILTRMFIEHRDAVLEVCWSLRHA